MTIIVVLHCSGVGRIRRRAALTQADLDRAHGGEIPQVPGEFVPIYSWFKRADGRSSLIGEPGEVGRPGDVGVVSMCIEGNEGVVALKVFPGDVNRIGVGATLIDDLRAGEA